MSWQRCFCRGSAVAPWTIMETLKSRRLLVNRQWYYTSRNRIGFGVRVYPLQESERARSSSPALVSKEQYNVPLSPSPPLISFSCCACIYSSKCIVPYSQSERRGAWGEVRSIEGALSRPKIAETYTEASRKRSYIQRGAVLLFDSIIRCEVSLAERNSFEWRVVTDGKVIRAPAASLFVYIARSQWLPCKFSHFYSSCFSLWAFSFLSL